MNDLEYVERELSRAEAGMSDTLSSMGAETVRAILALPGVEGGWGPTAKAVLQGSSDWNAS